VSEWPSVVAGIHLVCGPQGAANRWFLLLAAFLLTPVPSLLAADTITFTASPRSTVVEREGITGAGQVVSAGARSLILYPNHPDDFGGSGGMGASLSEDGGATWKAQPDDWPLPKMVDAWADRLSNGDLLAFGIRWVPDPQKRGEVAAKDVPADAYSIATSRDGGQKWVTEPAVIDCPPDFGVIARPLPHTFEEENGALFMPAYSWGKHANHALLLTSADRGKHWTVLSSITTAAAMVKAGAPVTTPWLETTVTITKDGSWLAIMRTGSNAAAVLMCARSLDRGKTWSTPEKVLAGPQRRPVAGKLPTLHLLPNGVLALLTAHTKNHCRLIASADGTGREWTEAHIITSQAGGNAGMTVADRDSLLVITPANRRIDAWRVTLRPQSAPSAELAAPANVTFAKGLLSWSAVEGAAAYRVTPVLIKPAATYVDTQLYPHVTIQTLDAAQKLDLRRQLLIGGTYVFEVAAVDREGRQSSPTRSSETAN
jgi:BNR repeat-like domain